MIIETKFNVGDEVWYMKDNKPFKDEITIIVTQTNYPIFWDYKLDIRTEIMYSLKIEGKLYNENQLFKTKEELIN